MLERKGRNLVEEAAVEIRDRVGAVFTAGAHQGEEGGSALFEFLRIL